MWKKKDKLINDCWGYKIPKYLEESISIFKESRILVGISNIYIDRCIRDAGQRREPIVHEDFARSL